MARYTINEFRGGVADGEQNVVDSESKPSPYHAKAFTGIDRFSVYRFQGIEQDGSATLRVYTHTADVSLKRLQDYLDELSRDEP